jgi:hypothetical protein
MGRCSQRLIPFFRLSIMDIKTFTQQRMKLQEQLFANYGILVPIISIEKTDLIEHRVGVVNQADPTQAAKQILRQTHRVATPDEFEGYKIELENRTTTYKKLEEERLHREGKMVFVTQQMVAPGVPAPVAPVIITPPVITVPTPRPALSEIKK